MNRYGIDFTAPRYQHEYGLAGGELCTSCYGHDIDLPNPWCELRQAQVAEMREQGKEANHCRICHFPYEGPPLGLCPAHERMLAPVAHRPRRFRFSDYRADGKGCVEKTHAVDRIWLER